MRTPGLGVGASAAGYKPGKINNMAQQTKQKKKTVELDAAGLVVDTRSDLAKLLDETMKDFIVGSIVPGKVIEVRGNEVLVDIGYKSEGVISGQEFGNLENVKPGDPINVLLAEIENDEGMVILSKRYCQMLWMGI